MARVLLGLPVALVGCAAGLPVVTETRTDVWTQVETDQVDVLFVIDDSSSMAEEQERLALGFDAFADELEDAGSDFHLGVAATSLGDGQAGPTSALVGEPPYLTGDDPGYRRAFGDRARLGVHGSDQERGLTAALLALSPEAVGPGGVNEGFLREGSQLLVVFVSDEDDCSDAGALVGQPATACYEPASPLITVPQWLSDLAVAVGSADRITVAAVTAPPDPACAGVYPGLRYRQAASMSSGVSADVCRGDWGPLLGTLGRLAAGVRTRFQLSRAAEPGSLEVWVDDVELPSVAGWHYEVDSWTLVFDRDAVPARGATVSVTYTVDTSRSVRAGLADDFP